MLGWDCAQILVFNKIQNTKPILSYASKKRKYVKTTEMDGWTCNFTFFSTAFQVYQDDGLMIMKEYVQWNPVVYEWNNPTQGSNPGPLDQSASA